MKEIWKDIKGYEGIYQVSNFGRIKSLKRYVNHWQGGNRIFEGKILKSYLSSSGYPRTILSINNKRKSFFIHLLVMDSFGKKRNGRKLLVDHKDDNKQNPRLDNLQLLTHRKNIIKGCEKRGRSLSTGVIIDHNIKGKKKFRARIDIDGRKRSLGYYYSDYEASQAYQKALRQLGE